MSAIDFGGVSGETSGPDNPVTAAHGTLVGIVLMIIVLVFLVEVAGSSHEWAIAMGLLLLGPLMLYGMNNSNKFSSWVTENPIS